MNPFTESTVARPLGMVSVCRNAGTAAVAPNRTRRSLIGLALGTAGLMAAAAVPGLSGATDVNRATQQQLQGVRGIGPKTAQTIIAERTRGGSYESFEDLSNRIKGIGPKKAAALQASGLTLGPNAANKTSAPPALKKAP
ncbi:MAG TPA: DUF655 domain-containing protein [Candidimonas sp.]|nr:DUF655 domain-containing protein [Candidimonas sp.]